MQVFSKTYAPAACNRLCETPPAAAPRRGPLRPPARRRKRRPQRPFLLFKSIGARTPPESRIGADGPGGAGAAQAAPPASAGAPNALRRAGDASPRPLARAPPRGVAVTAAIRPSASVCGPMARAPRGGGQRRPGRRHRAGVGRYPPPPPAQHPSPTRRHRPGRWPGRASANRLVGSRGRRRRSSMRGAAAVRAGMGASPGRYVRFY